MLNPQYVIRIALQRDKVESFDQYPFSLPVVRSLDHVDLHPKMTYFIGENGSGKSTLLEAIAVSLGFNAEGGSKNFSFGTRRSHSELHQFLRVAKGYLAPHGARPQPPWPGCAARRKRGVSLAGRACAAGGPQAHRQVPVRRLARVRQPHVSLRPRDHGRHDAMLEFEIEMDGILVNGVGIIKWNEAGKIVEFKVILRPLKAVNLIHQMMGARLQTGQARGHG